MERKIGTVVATWLDQRGIDLELAAKEGVFSALPDGSELVPGAVGRYVAFPYFEDGKEVGCKYRYTLKKEFRQTKGGKQILYRRDSLKGAKVIVLTEGEMDCLSAVQSGFPAAASVPGGAPMQTGQKNHAYFEDARECFEKADSVILAFDADGPGACLFEDAKAVIGAAKCRYVRYPDNCKDLNDALLLGGEELVKKILTDAPFVPVNGIYRPSDLPDLPPLDVYRAGISEDFDHHIGICKQHTSVWTGFANHGKSAVLKQVQTNLARRYDWKIATLSAEDDYQRNFRGDILRCFAMRHPRKVDRETMARFNEFYEEHWLLIAPPEDQSITFSWVFEMMETAVVRHGVDLIVIDPFTEIDLELRSGEIERDVIKDALTAFNRFARRYNVHVAIVAHPTKPGQNGERNPPLGYDVSGAAHFKNKPYLGVTVHRDPDEKCQDVTQIVVWKSKRREEMGPNGTFYLRYLPDCSTYVPMTRAEYEAQKDGLLERGPTYNYRTGTHA